MDKCDVTLSMDGPEGQKRSETMRVHQRERERDRQTEMERKKERKKEEIRKKGRERDYKIESRKSKGDGGIEEVGWEEKHRSD